MLLAQSKKVKRRLWAVAKGLHADRQRLGVRRGAMSGLPRGTCGQPLSRGKEPEDNQEGVNGCGNDPLASLAQ